MRLLRSPLLQACSTPYGPAEKGRERKQGYRHEAHYVQAVCLHCNSGCHPIFGRGTSLSTSSPWSLPYPYAANVIDRLDPINRHPQCKLLSAIDYLSLPRHETHSILGGENQNIGCRYELTSCVQQMATRLHRRSIVCMAALEPDNRFNPVRTPCCMHDLITYHICTLATCESSCRRLHLCLQVPLPHS